MKKDEWKKKEKPWRLIDSDVANCSETDAWTSICSGNQKAGFVTAIAYISKDLKQNYIGWTIEKE